MSSIQEQYWMEMHQLKTHINFIELMLESAESKDRWLRGFLAIASSGSIGAWVIWKEHSEMWAGIIAASQVISAIIPFFPYKGRIKSYSSLLHELEEIMVQAEFKWHSIAEGELTEKEINNARFEIKKAKLKSLKKHIPTTIPTDEKKHKQAEKTASDYLINFYSL